MPIRAPIYLDHHASTPLDPRVADVVARVSRDHPGNPASAGHAYGWAAAKIVELAREQVAALIGATAREIVFTSGATESDNLAVLGVAEAYGERGRHMVISGFEHDAVAAPCARHVATGGEVSVVAPDGDGLVDPDAVAAALRPDTVLVSVMAAQNEVGTLQPVDDLGRICKAAGVLFHTDAAQAVGKVPLDVVSSGVDLLSLSAHKLYGPMGVGALFVRRRDPRVALAPRQLGGGQERGWRSGTLNVPGIAGLGEACRLAAASMDEEAERLVVLRERLWARLADALPDIHLNGHASRRLPGSLNVSFGGVRAHGLLGAVTQVAVSSGSACSSAESAPSPVLTAMGVAPELAAASLRMGLGRGTSEDDVDHAARVIIDAVRRLRSRSAI